MLHGGQEAKAGLTLPGVTTSSEVAVLFTEYYSVRAYAVVTESTHMFKLGTFTGRNRPHIPNILRCEQIALLAVIRCQAVMQEPLLRYTAYGIPRHHSDQLPDGR